VDAYEIRTAERFDAADIVAVLSAADLGSRQLAFLKRTLASPRCRTLMGWDGGRPVATALAIRLDGATAWLANVAVVPDHQRRGLGRTLVDRSLAWLLDGGAQTVSLLATEAGRGLYARLGFVPDGVVYDKYRIPARLAPKGPGTVRPGTLTEALRLDAEATGEGRAPLLEPFAKRVVVAGAAADGDGARGYALALPWGGGPVVARDDEVAHALWWHVYGQAAGARWAVPDSNAAARALARRYGLGADGVSVRMRYGPGPTAPGPAAIWAAYSLAAG
jgi:GNAT superfamily N-acetyltransferase